MVNIEGEVIPGITSSDVRAITDQIYSRKDGNHPHVVKEESNGFLDILENGKSDISASPILLKKVSN